MSEKTGAVLTEATTRTVLIEPIGISFELSDGKTVLDAVMRATKDFPNTCAGKGTCGKCLVRAGAGQFNEPTEQEIAKLSPEQLADGWRLACQTLPLSERVSVEVRETKGRRRILTASQLHHGKAHPMVARRVVELEEATFDDPRSDRDRLLAAVGAREIVRSALAELPAVLRDHHNWKATVTTADGVVIDVEPATAQQEIYGVAVDIGTSKIIGYLFELEHGRLMDHEAIENPQMRYGEEVVSRIAKGIQEGVGELTRVVHEGINQVLQALAERQGISPRHIYDMTVVGNTGMHHLALGLAPDGLGSAPFAPAVNRPVQLRGREFGLSMNPEGGVHFLPPIAGFVGSDALAVVAATRLPGRRRPVMAIDIGTNTEIALAVNGEVTVTSCASGPAFEGYQIHNGMKAVAGAIEKVSFTADGSPASIVTIDEAPPVGICGSGVVDVLAGLIRHGVVDRTGRMQRHKRVREGHAGLEYVLTTGPNGDIVFNQHDVRQLQLAKGAISTGWFMLLRGKGLEPDDLCHVYIAGAFGNYLDLDNSLALDLFPPVPRDRVAFVGNAAGVGAQMALIDTRARKRMAKLRSGIGFLDLATDAEFHAAFAARLGFTTTA
jgi:uncharacterized 2Fe-2S/4Fe-4S cluster protein (DUF4445 family)